MEPVYCIYKLTCQTNGKGYVGYTSNFKRRLRQHKKTAKKGKGYAIHAAIRKYGWDDFVAEELYVTKDKLHALVMEDDFIVMHETKGIKGYNITRGGQSGPPKGLMTEDLRLHLSKVISALWRDPVMAAKYRQSHYRCGNKMASIWKRREERRKANPGVTDLRSLGMPGNPSRTGQKQSIEERMKRRLPDQTILRAKDLRSTGLTYEQIAAKMNSEYIYNKHGKPWSTKGISALFERIHKLDNIKFQRTYSVTYPNGEIEIFHCLKTFCQLHGLNDKSVSVSITRGYTLRNGMNITRYADTNN